MAGSPTLVSLGVARSGLSNFLRYIVRLMSMFISMHTCMWYGVRVQSTGAVYYILGIG